MAAIRISTTIGADRRLVIDLPPDTPTGPVELVIRPIQESQQDVRALLIAADLLAVDLGIPDDMEPVSDEELDGLGYLPPDARRSIDLINEDRGTY